jgi:hypothetical protein
MSTVSAVALPPDILAYLDQLNDADCAAGDLIAGLSDDQANWQPNSGAAWSLAQCLDHMSTTNMAYLQPLQTAASKAPSGHIRFRTGGFLSKWFLAKTEPPVAMKIKAPTKIQPASELTAAEALARFQRSNDALRTFASETSGINLCAVRFKNPFVPVLMNFTVASGLLIIAAHNRRHLWQMEQVLKQVDFPR